MDSEEEFDNPEEGDYTTGDHSKFYQYHKLVVTVDIDATTDEMWGELDDHMDANQYWPNVWFISDHGNAHLMSRPEKEPRHQFGCVCRDCAEARG